MSHSITNPFSDAGAVQVDPALFNGEQTADALDAFNVDPIVATVEFQSQPQVATPQGNTAVDTVFGKTVETTKPSQTTKKNMRGAITIGTLVAVVALLFFTGVIKLGK